MTRAIMCPRRGGIDIGLGALVMPEGILYSPAVSRAYELESKEAVVARTVAGDRFFEFLESQIQNEDRSLMAELSRQMASKVRSMFVEDASDKGGTRTLDFFGPACRENMDPKVALEYGPKAWRYVTAAHEKAKATKPQKTVQKYAWLVEYMEPRLHLWTSR